MREGMRITEGQFDIQMQRIYQTFGEKNYSSQRMALIWQVAKQVSYQDFEKICNHLLATFRYAPLPKDFADAVTAEARGKNFEDIGRYSDQVRININQIDCASCNDVGVVKVDYRDGGGTTLMRCLCAQAALHSDEIVQWDRALGQVFNTAPCPAEWFKPNIKDSDSDKQISREIEKTMHAWGGRLKLAKDFWNYEKRKARENP